MISLRSTLAAVGLGAFGLFATGPRNLAATAPPSLLSPALIRSATASGGSSLPTLSADGRYVVFLSSADNLVTNDTRRGSRDVFLTELQTGRTSLVSANTNGIRGNGSASEAAISADGRHVVFTSRASDLVAGDLNDAPDIFLRDSMLGTTVLVSASPGGRSGTGESRRPFLTPDGRHVAFESRADDLVAGDTNGTWDVFVHEVASGVTRRISIPSSESSLGQEPSGPSHSILLSDDASWALFASSARNLAPAVSQGPRVELFIHDLKAGTHRMVDVTSAVTGPTVTLTPTAHDLSGDGRHLAFFGRSSMSNQVPNGFFWVDLATDSARRIPEDPNQGVIGSEFEDVGPLLSADGSTMVYEVRQSRFLSGDRIPLVYAWNAMTGHSELVSSGGLVGNPAGDPPTEVIESPQGRILTASRDGAFVAFLGGTTNDPPDIAPARQLMVRHRVSGETRRVSRRLDGTPSRWVGTEFVATSFSGDGRRFVFDSRDDALVPEDLNHAHDVFLYDWDADRVSVISTTATESQTGSGPVPGYGMEASRNGDLLAYCLTGPWGSTDTNNAIDILAVNLRGGPDSIHHVSANWNGTGSGDDHSWEPSVSADGRFVAFTSLANDLVAEDHNGSADVFVRDLMTGTTELVSRTPEGRPPDTGISGRPAISPDGRYVAFDSSSPELMPDDANQRPDVFLLDRVQRTVSRLSDTIEPAGTFQGSYGPVFSPDGRWVAFESYVAAGRWVYARNLESAELRLLSPPVITYRGMVLPRDEPAAVFSPEGGFAIFSTLTSTSRLHTLHDFQQGISVQLLVDAWAPRLSSGARRVVYLAETNATEGRVVRMLDRSSQTDVLISASMEGVPAGGCSGAVISTDGRFVVFSSRAANLAAGDDNQVSDVFLRDVELGTTVLLSAARRDGAANGPAGTPWLVGDRGVVFQTFADNLQEGDLNQGPDLFLVQLPGAESGFRITVITRMATGEVTLRWPAESGKSYRVEFTEDLSKADWAELQAAVLVEEGVATTMDGGATGVLRRYYRAVEVP